MTARFVVLLFLFLLLSGLGIYHFYGDAFGEQKAQSSAAKILEVSSAINKSMDAYAQLYGDGQVDLGDPTLGEDVLLYVKNKKLLKNNVGFDNQNNSTLYYDKTNKTIKSIVDSERVCAEINRQKDGVPIDTPVPVCGDVDDVLSCCVNP